MIKNLAVFALFFAFSISAAAAERAENLLFETYWSGFKVGEMRLIINEDAKNYHVVATISSKGIAKLVSNYSSINAVSGKKQGDKFVPKLYHSKWWRKKELQDIELQFSNKGDVTKTSLTPPDRVGKYPEVADNLKKQVFDPVTAAIVSRETIRKEIAKNPKSRAVFVIPSFDGKRRFDVICEIKGYEQIMLDGKMRKLLHINLYRKPIAGFPDKDLKEMREDNQNIDFYVNEDFVPVWGEAKAQMGSATIRLVK